MGKTHIALALGLAACQKSLAVRFTTASQLVHEMIEARDEKRLLRLQDQLARVIRENGEALRAHPMSPVSGNAEGDVTVVEFFDYQCGFCKRGLPTMEALLETDANVRVVWKEFPILGPVSVFAARASMAAARQGRYLPFHLALMKEPELTEEKVLEIANRTGLEMGRLFQDMEDPAIQAYLDETRALAQQIGINGTPAFVIGGALVPGLVDAARMKDLVAAARSGADSG